MLTDLPVGQARRAAEDAARRCSAALQAPFPVGAELVQLGASAGIACSPADGSGAAELLTAADAAMYEVKSGRRVVPAQRTA